MTSRVLISVVVGLALLVGVGGVMYAFGTPERATVSPVGATVDVTAPEQTQQPSEAAAVSDEALAQNPSAADAEAPAPDPSSPLAIEIPGCVCHSDDPKLVKEHEGYRMNQCAGCHVGQVPTGE